MPSLYLYISKGGDRGHLVRGGLVYVIFNLFPLFLQAIGEILDTVVSLDIRNDNVIYNLLFCSY